MPQNAAGTRMDPSVSSATPSGARRAAIAAAVPPLLPPGMRVKSEGWRTAPNGRLLLVQPKDSSCRFVLPSTMAPAPRRAATTGASSLGRKWRSAGVPPVVGVFRVLTLSFTGMGRPNRGPGFAPAARSRSRDRASSSTRSGSKVMNAFRAFAARHRASSASAYRSAVSAPCDMRATASTALRLQSSDGPATAVPLPFAAVLAAAPDMSTLAEPSTNARRDISGGSDTISPQRLTHAVQPTAAVADHRHIGRVDGETFRTAGGDEILARGRHQHALLAQRDDVAAQLHGIAVGNGDGADALRAQPIDELGFHRFDAYDRQTFGDHAHLHVQVQEMRIERIGVKLPPFGFEPALQLPHGGLDGALARIAASGDARFQHHEVASFDVAGGDQVVYRDAGVEIESQAGRILAAPVGLLQLHDHRAPRSHDAAVAREDLIGKRRLGRQIVHFDARLPVDVDHLIVLPPCNRKVELQPDAFGSLTHGISGLPRKMIDRSDQNIAQGSVLAVDSPVIERARPAPLDSCAQLHRDRSSAFLVCSVVRRIYYIGASDDFSGAAEGVRGIRTYR